MKKLLRKIKNIIKRICKTIKTDYSYIGNGNIVYYNNKKIRNLNEMESNFKINLFGKDNIIYLNNFKGNGCIYVEFSCNNCEFHFGENNIVNNFISVNFWGTSAIKCENAKIIIGNNNVFNGDNIKIISPINKELKIGNNNLFAGDITFWGRNDHIIYDLKTRKRLNNDNNIHIGNNNWICQKATFMPNAKILNNCVIGYGSFVNKIFEKNNCLIVGNPAMIKKENINWSISSNYSTIDFDNNILIKEEK